ncbi:MAG: MBL fold metallo-hydrolase [Pirellulales bacterium]|nr:MBL fold metallo-hydrolase [Pirellulales bacterium]
MPAVTRRRWGSFAIGLLLIATPATAWGQGIAQQNILQAFADQKEALKVNDHIYQASGFSNTYLVTTSAGNVIIDTSTSAFAGRHKKLLQAVNKEPIKYIILTHGHPDHMGGIRQWREPGTEVIAQANYPAFREYHRRLLAFHARRAAAQYNLALPVTLSAAEELLRPDYDATITFEKEYTFKLGELTFELHAAPGETQDQLAIWIPELKTAFLGDNYYETFPNIYTLRGTEFRSPALWIKSLEMVRSWHPELLLGSHVEPIKGAKEIEQRLTHYIEAIRYVDNETVKGMNAGKDVHTLMREIKLPDELKIGEQYGRLTWSIRGIYEGYVGWFDELPQTMYAAPASSVHADLVELAGGPDGIVKKARERFDSGQLEETLQLLDVVLNPERKHEGALKLRIETCMLLNARTDNVIEQGWLAEFIRRDERALKELSKPPKKRSKAS